MASPLLVTVKLRRLLAVAFLAVLTMPMVPAPAGASESSVYGGACAMTGSMSFSPGLTPTPTPQNLFISMGGLCQVNISLLATGSIRAGGPTTSPGMSCSAGLAVLAADFQLQGTPPLPSANGGSLAVVNVGGTYAALFTWQVYRFAAVGTIAPTDATPALCLAGTPQTYTNVAAAWALEDPTLPVG